MNRFASLLVVTVLLNRVAAILEGGGGTQSKEDYMTSPFVRFLTLFDERGLGIIVLHVMVPKTIQFLL